MKRFTFIFSIIMLASLLLVTTSWAGSIVVIVNSANPASSISESDMADYFTKKKRLWPGNATIIPIDRNEGSEQRNLFLRRVLGKSSGEMASYWIEKKQITGDSAPQQAISDTMVVNFVKALPWAIGYVSNDSVSGAQGVKVIKTISD